MATNTAARSTDGRTTRRGSRNGLWAGSTEARPGIITTEFWLALLASVVIIAAGYISDEFDIDRGWTLGTVILASYIISRGLAKAGSSERFIADLRDRDDS